MDLSEHEILVVDDVKFTRSTLVRMLQGLGCKAVHEAGDGREALDLLGRQPGIACVVTDLDMPQLDGLGLLQAIRCGSGGTPRDLPVVLFTGDSDFERLGAALLLDLDAFLPKPASRQGLGKCLERVFGPRQESEFAIAAAETYRGVPLGPAPAPPPPSAAAQREERRPLEQLPEDGVLARDLLFRNGRLLLPAGTRLTPRILQRLRELEPMASITGEAWLLLDQGGVSRP